MRLHKLIYFLIGLAVILALLLLFFILRPKSDRIAGQPVTTVSSLADVSRRLELAGYRYVKENNIGDEHFVTYERNIPDATYTAEIVRWSGDQRLLTLAFGCSTDHASFDSKEAPHIVGSP